MRKENFDKVFILLLFNALLIIIGYAIAVATKQASVPIMKILRVFCLFFSLIFVVNQKDFTNSFLVSINYKLVLFLFFILPAISVFSISPIYSFDRTQTFVVPLLYVFISVNILLYRYGQEAVLRLFSKLVFLVYSIPILSFFIFGADFSGKSIYGQASESGRVFVSNHFGWSSSIILCASVFFQKNHKFNSYIKKVLFFIIILGSLYLLIVSGTRSALLAILIALIVFIVQYRGISVVSKLFFLSIPLSTFLYFSNIENSPIESLIQRTKYQQEVSGEGRVIRANYMIEEFNKSPLLWITGTGIFDYTLLRAAKKNYESYHNSYLELMFGIGLPLFFLFLYFMLFTPIRVFISRISKRDLVFIPLVLIPFFESNLTGGQFLFFPWFIYIFILNCRSKFYNFGVLNYLYYPSESQKKTPAGQNNEHI